MAFSIGSRAPRGIVGLDVDDAYVAAVEVVDSQMTRAVSMEIAPGIVSEGEVVDPSRLAHALGGFFKQHRLPRKVRLGVANQQIVVRSFTIPQIDGDDERSAAVRFQAQDAIAMPLDEAVLDYHVVGETTTPGGVAHLRVVAVAAREAMVTRVIEAARGAGLKPDSIDLDAFALVRALGPVTASPTASAPEDAASSTPSTGGARVYCYLASVINLAVADGSDCLFARPLAVSRDDDGEVAPAALADQVRPSIHFYMQQPDAREVTNMVLAGPGAQREGLADELGSLLSIPVEVAATPDGLPGEAVGDSPARYTVALGLAMGETP
jgi:type IV pilus assembly protein PilM